MNETLIRQRFSQAAHSNYYFAAVRLPHSETVHFLYTQQAPQLVPVGLNMASALPVFVCSPYSAGNLAYALQAETYYQNHTLVAGNEIPLTPTTNTLFTHYDSNIALSQSEYEHYVAKGVEAIQKNKLDKIVAARCQQIQLPKTFDAAQYFALLCDTYAHACVYFFHLPNMGTWCGATPEKLITVEKNVLQTVALAGTKPNTNDTEWTDKEHDEQYMTEAFIEQLFKELKLTGYQKSAVETITAGAIQHLCSTFTWKAKPEVLQQKFGKIVAGINPTPAVCGLPQFEASLFISQHEQLERRFYSGFIGLMQQNTSHLFVNLRCMQIGSEASLLYAGAGITQDSVPENEWFETAQKMETLTRLLQSNN
jgi:isochorismate synthase